MWLSSRWDVVLSFSNADMRRWQGLRKADLHAASTSAANGRFTMMSMWGRMPCRRCLNRLYRSKDSYAETLLDYATQKCLEPHKVTGSKYMRSCNDEAGAIVKSRTVSGTCIPDGRTGQHAFPHPGLDDNRYQSHECEDQILRGYRNPEVQLLIPPAPRDIRTNLWILMGKTACF